ncbi:MAG: hypothetical protein Q7R73_03310 [bacterium]|nr:hypothetical protein [bacterium]
MGALAIRPRRYSRATPEWKDIFADLTEKREQFEETTQDLLALLEKKPTFLQRILRGAGKALPIRRLHDYIDEQASPLTVAGKLMREHLLDYQEGILLLKDRAEITLEEQKEIARTIAQAKAEGWDEEQLFDYVLKSLAEEDINLQVDPKVAGIMRIFSENASPEERKALAAKLMEHFEGLLETFEKSERAVIAACDTTINVFMRYLLQYWAYAKTEPVVSDMREVAINMTQSERAAFVARDLLIRTVQDSRQAIMAVIQAAEVLDRSRITGAELMKELQAMDRDVTGRLRALNAAPAQQAIVAGAEAHAQVVDAEFIAVERADIERAEDTATTKEVTE